ncbi:hypothetical protein [Clostridium sporogenes]|uniref:hypothetical protein n=1 Tax=Clostridium sporogenes TaxID=1509 RepID=UPI001FABEFE4|nr:hypothetical protein [Clostridium sporogenes]
MRIKKICKLILGLTLNLSLIASVSSVSYAKEKDTRRTGSAADKAKAVRNFYASDCHIALVQAGSGCTSKGSCQCNTTKRAAYCSSFTRDENSLRNCPYTYHKHTGLVISFSKFSNDKIGVIYDEEKLSKFKVIMNSLDTSEGIKKIELPKDANIESFKYSYHIQPNLKYVEDNNVYEGYFLLYILVGDSEGKSYIIFSGTELSYVLDKNNTNILKEIFLNVKKQQ